MTIQEPERDVKSYEAAPAPALGAPTRLAQGAGLLFVIYAKFKALLFPALKLIPFFLSLAVYSVFFGWKYAALFLSLLAIHECGHYVVMKRFHIDASFPMFIPGLGAMIFTRSLGTLTLVQQAIVGYAGPLAGTIGALVFAAYGFSRHDLLWISASYAGFFLNAFNLLPVPPFDGSHLVRLVSDKLWVVGLVIFAALCWYVPSMQNPFVILIVVLAIPRVFQAWSQRGNVQIQPTSLAIRLLFALLYFGLIGVDVGGMLATHVSLEG